MPGWMETYPPYRSRWISRGPLLVAVTVITLSCQAGFYAASEKVIVHLARGTTSNFFFAGLPSTQLIMVQRQIFNSNIT